MPRACLAYIKYRNGEAAVAIYRLTNNYVFGLNEMKRWILEADPEVENVSVSKIPVHLEDSLEKAFLQTGERRGSNRAV